MYGVYFMLQGKEFETRLKEKKPGDLTDDLRTALGMPLGPVSSLSLTLLAHYFVVRIRISIVFMFQNSAKYPPPWLIAMQRYGPPPSYPNLKVAGLNAAIPHVRSPHSHPHISQF